MKISDLKKGIVSTFIYIDIILSCGDISVFLYMKDGDVSFHIKPRTNVAKLEWLVTGGAEDGSQSLSELIKKTRRNTL